MLQLICFNGIGLLRALTEEVRERKAHPYLKIEDPEINRMLLESGDEALWENQARLDQLPLMKHMEASIGIRGAENIYENSKVTRAATVAYSQNFRNPVQFHATVNHTNWPILPFPA